MLGSNSVYAPEELIFLRRVMDEAVEALPVLMRTQASKAIIARRLLHCAATGQRDRTELLLAALADFNSARWPIAEGGPLR